MFKRITIMLAALATTLALTGNALATFADLELVRVYYDRNGSEIASDLGKVKDLTGTGASKAGSFGALTTGFAAYFALDRGTNQLWVSGSTTSTSVINGGSNGLTSTKSGTTSVYSNYNTQGGTEFSGLASATNSYKNKLSATQGTMASAISAASRLNTEASIAGLITDGSGSVTQTLYFWPNGLTTTAADKVGLAVATITTDATGNTTISTPFTSVAGACGSANGQSFPTAPTDSLCSSGTASAPTGTGPWTWFCVGQGSSGSNATCSASLQLQSYTITATVNGANGTITCDSPVTQGSNSVCTITPDAGFHLATLTDEGADVLSNVVSNSYTITNVTANHGIQGSFAADAKTIPTITWATPAAITYATPLSATQLNATASDPSTSASVPGTFAYTPAINSVLNSGDQPLSVTFTPTDTVKYSSATASVSLTVNKAALTVTADNLSKTTGSANPNLTYTVNGFVNGDTSAVLTGSPSLATTATAASPVGTYPITPSTGSLAAANYSFTFANGTLTVTDKLVPTITWPVPAAITYGTALSATQLNATASVPGTFAYTPALGSIPNAGSQTLSVTFTPNDINTYASTTASVSLTINKAVPATTWATPAAITYATPLSATQLNAIASVAGTFAYTPAIASVPNAGTQTLSVTFTPADSANFTTATATVNLTVNKAIVTVTADNLGKTAGATNPTLTFSVSGFVNSDSAAVLTGSPSLATTATTASPAGTYPITVSAGSLAAANYSFSFVDGTLTVTEVAAYPSGDVNGDSKVDIGDALKCLRYVVDLDPLTSMQWANANVAPLVNGKPQPDTKVDIGDALVILKKVVNLVSW